MESGYEYAEDSVQSLGLLHKAALSSGIHT